MYRFVVLRKFPETDIWGCVYVGAIVYTWGLSLHLLKFEALQFQQSIVWNTICRFCNVFDSPAPVREQASWTTRLFEQGLKGEAGMSPVIMIQTQQSTGFGKDMFKQSRESVLLAWLNIQYQYLTGVAI